MSIVKKIKSLLPVSSRSFHAMHEDLARSIETNGVLLQELRQLRADCDELKHALDAFESQSLPLLWDLYRKDGESEKDAKLRFFKMLPKATGALRAHQLKLIDLLRDFDSVCKENGITYFLASGTLLGAVRHEGFIPWDDDVDVGVMHDDIDRLIEALQGDERFAITTLYDQYVFCRQVRFKHAESDDSKDPFIDLFIYEYSRGETEEDRSMAVRLRTEMMDEFRALGESDPDGYPLDVYLGEDADPRILRSIREVYEGYRTKARELDLYSDQKNATSIVWSIENVSYGNPTQIIPIEDRRDLEEASFEGLALPIVRNSEKLLEGHYGDWLSVPRDFNTHKHYLTL